MEKIKKVRVLLCTLFLLFIWNVANAQIEKLGTFAKLYGYVRWFYPGDEAAQIDWDRLAVYGVQQVEQARDEQEFKKILNDLFKPVAPVLEIFDASENLTFDEQSVMQPAMAENKDNLKPVLWMHYGVGTDSTNPIYKSMRINRDTVNSYLGAVFAINDISSYKGHEFKVSAYIKTDKSSYSRAGILLSTRRNNSDSYNEFLGIGEKDVEATTQWKKIEKTIQLDSMYNNLVVGFACSPGVSVSFDSITFAVRDGDAWKVLTLPEKKEHWDSCNFTFRLKCDTLTVHNQTIGLEIASSIVTPQVGEYIKKDIGNGLFITMPIALWADLGHTYPRADTKALNQLKKKLDEIQDTSLNTGSRAARLSNILIAWNVFQHFYPYFDVVRCDWGAVLPQTLECVYEGGDGLDYYDCLCKMVEQLEDGHGLVIHDLDEQWGLPFAVDLVENQLAIVASKLPDYILGDVIISIDGKPAMEKLQELENQISGSPQFKRYRALNLFSADDTLSVATIKLLRDGEEKILTCKRYCRCNAYFDLNKETGKPTINCGNGIYYLDKSSYTFDEMLPILKEAKGLVIGERFSLWELLPHLIKEPLWSAPMNVPINSYPDRSNTYYETSRWQLMPQSPHIDAKVVFLTYPSIISSGETMMAIVDRYKLGPLVGDATAGTNGNINTILLMGGYSIRWTGMQVLKHDGSTLHLVGYAPDVPVTRSIEAIKAGRDEYLEKAIEVLNSGEQ